MGRLNHYDRIAPFYDGIASLTFAGAIKRSQAGQVEHLSSAKSIAILGGGTGWIAQKILTHSSPKIVYIEASSRMLEIAKRNLISSANRVTFVHGTEEDLADHAPVDAVVANFYLDLFDDNRLVSVARIINESMSPNGKLLVTDFVDERPWHRFLLRVMYRFFRLTTSLITPRLPSWERAVRSADFQQLSEKRFFGGFIKSIVYIKL